MPARQSGSLRQQCIGVISAFVDSIDSQIILQMIRESKRGKAKTAWLKVIEKDLRGNIKLDVSKDPAEITITKLINVTRNREVWRTIVQNTMA